jgi:DNA-directed RNA polymerase I, II, and III subunit RPABC2
MGAPVLVDTAAETTELQTLAELELQAGILPVSVRRTLPNGMFQDIPLTWLIFGTDDIAE